MAGLEAGAGGMADPFEIVEEEARMQLADVGARLTQWRVLAASGKDKARASKVGDAILGVVSELSVDLDDMAATVGIAAKDPAKFGLSDAEISRRQQFVRASRAQAAEIRAEVEGTPSVQTPRREGAERGERSGLLSKDSDSATSGSGARAARAAADAQRLARQQNEQLIQQQEQACARRPSPRRKRRGGRARRPRQPVAPAGARDGHRDAGRAARRAIGRDGPALIDGARDRR